MLLFITLSAAVACLCGLLIRHWAPLCLVSIVASIIFFSAMPWDLLLLPKWIALLTGLQLAWFAGSVVRFFLDERTQRRSEQHPEWSLDRERVLIVEDEAAIAASLADEVHAASGETVGPVGSVSAALQIIEKEKVDGAVLDIRLEDGDATPVALSLMTRRVPFVILSGVNVPTSIATMKPDVPVFRKPVPLSHVVRGLVKELLRSRRATADV